MHFGSFLGALLELLGVRMSPKSEQKIDAKISIDKQGAKEREALTVPWARRAVRLKKAQLQSEALDVQLKQPSSKQ